MKRAAEPLAEGVIVPMAVEHGEALSILAREAASILRSLRGESRVAARVPEGADFVLLVVEADADVAQVELPDLKDRVGASVALAERRTEGRLANARARKRLRAQGAVLGAREMVFAPGDIGILGVESDGMRERLQDLLQTLVLDAERLRLRREGWEEPES